MLWLPGESFNGPAPALTELELALSKQLSEHIWMLAGDIGARSLTRAPGGLEKASQYIEYVFKNCSYQPSRQEFSAEAFALDNKGIPAKDATTYRVSNIIAELPGEKYPDEIVLVGAHYDTEYDCPGANDNGSGVAGLLEIAGLLRPLQLDRSVRFVAFANEEQPFARTDQMGSYQYASLCKGRGDKIVAMLCLETIGFYTDEPNTQQMPDPSLEAAMPSVGNFIAFVSNIESTELMKKAISSFRRHTLFPSQAMAAPESVRGTDYSDHYYFWKHGYSAIMVTDTAFYRYSQYHQPTDTPDKIDYEKLARVVCGLAKVIEDLCSKEYYQG